MKERLTTLALALGALALFYALLFPKPAPERDEPDLPLSTESRDHGYQALWRWLKADKIPLRALHQPYTELEQGTARGDVLITTVPPRVAARRDEVERLSAWVSRGNTLLVLAALDDTPPWSLAADPGFLKSLGRMTQLDFEALPEHSSQQDVQTKERQRKPPTLDALRRAIESAPALLRARGSTPLFEGVHSVLARSEFPASRWKGSALDGSAVLEIAERIPRPEEAAEPVAWLRRQGSGQILVLGFASIFDNALIAEADNARLFSNIIAWSRAPEGHVIFDDDHQGAVEYYDAKAFFHDPRLHRTLLWGVVLWFLFVLGWQRLRPAAADWNRADVTHSIGITGEFFASVLTPADAAARLFANFFGVVRGILGVGGSASPWDALAADARVSSADRIALERLYARVQAGKRVDLTKIQNLISGIRGSLE
jgi:hypothetical protein